MSQIHDHEVLAAQALPAGSHRCALVGRSRSSLLSSLSSAIHLVESLLVFLHLHQLA